MINTVLKQKTAYSDFTIKVKLLTSACRHGLLPFYLYGMSWGGRFALVYTGKKCIFAESDIYC